MGGVYINEDNSWKCAVEPLESFRTGSMHRGFRSHKIDDEYLSTVLFHRCVSPSNELGDLIRGESVVAHKLIPFCTCRSDGSPFLKKDYLSVFFKNMNKFHETVLSNHDTIFIVPDIWSEWYDDKDHEYIKRCFHTYFKGLGNVVICF